jgi:hypothetical protein
MIKSSANNKEWIRGLLSPSINSVVMQVILKAKRELISNQNKKIR